MKRLMTGLLMLGLIVSVTQAGAVGPGDFVMSAVPFHAAYYYVHADGSYHSDSGSGALTAVAVEPVTGKLWMGNAAGTLMYETHPLPGAWAQSGGWGITDFAVATDGTVYFGTNSSWNGGMLGKLTGSGFGYTGLSASWGTIKKLDLQSDNSRIVADSGNVVWRETPSFGYNSQSIGSGIIDMSVLPNNDVIVATATDVYRINSGFTSLTLEKSFASAIVAMDTQLDGSVVVGTANGDVTRYLGASETTVSGFGTIKDILSLYDGKVVIATNDAGGYLWKYSSDLSTYTNLGGGWGEVSDMYAVVPEPATLVILGLGGLLLRKSKK